MATSYIGNGQYVGLSSDTKPTAPSGYQFYETDIGDTFVSDGTYWWLRGIPSPFSTKKVGYFSMGTAGLTGVGMLSTLTNATGAGSQAFLITDSTNGRYLNMNSGTTVGNRGGVRTNDYVTLRTWNPRIRFRFKLIASTNLRLWLGFIGGAPTEVSGDDPLNGGIPGVLFGINTTTATNWVVTHNDATTTATTDDTGTAYDTNVHTVQIVADNNNTRFAWNLDGGAYTNLTTDIPSTTNGLGLVMEIETNDSGVAKNFAMFNVFVQSDK